MIRKLRLTACVAALLLLQTTVVHRFSYGFVRFDLLSLLVAFLALEASPKATVWSALAIGLLRDLTSCGRVGTSALLFVAGACGLLFLRERVIRQHIGTDLLLVFAFVLFCSAAWAAGEAALAGGPQLGPLLRRALGTAAFTALLSPFFFPLFEKAGFVRAERTRAS